MLKYYIILRRVNHPVGVREAQRILGFKSPGKSQRVLNKLVRYGLAERTSDGKYLIKKDPPVELIGRMIIRGRLLPKIMVITVYNLTLSITYILMSRPSFEIILLLILLNAPLTYEAIVEYRALKSRWKILEQ